MFRKIVYTLFCLLILFFLVPSFSFVFRSFLLFTFFLVTALLFPFFKTSNKRIRLFSGVAAVISFIFLLMLYPSRKTDEGSDQSIFIDENENIIKEPLPSYFLNFITEADVVKITRFYLPIVPFSIPFKNDFLEMDVDDNIFLKEYDETFKKPSTNQVTPFQLLQSLGMYSGIRHFYSSVPQNIINGNKLKVIVFLHGYMGNLQFYLNYFNSFENTLVLVPSTPNLWGRWGENDINNILKVYLINLEKHYSIDWQNIHLIGLSNGGSGVNVAIEEFEKEFSDFGFISTAPIATSTRPIYLICGMKDSFSGWNVEYARSYPFVMNLFFEKENHFAFLTQKEKILQFIRHTVF